MDEYIVEIDELHRLTDQTSVYRLYTSGRSQW
jgi:hypothetical protein